MAVRVLVVDDAAFMRMMVKDILSKNGYEVVGEAENGMKRNAAPLRRQAHRPHEIIRPGYPAFINLSPTVLLTGSRGTPTLRVSGLPTICRVIAER